MNQRYCHDRGNSVQIRGCSKIVGWNPPSPSIKMSERVSNLERWQILRGKKEKKKKILVGDPEPDLPGALSKIYYRREEILFKVRDIRWYYVPPFFFLVTLYQYVLLASIIARRWSMSNTGKSIFTFKTRKREKIFNSLVLPLLYLCGEKWYSRIVDFYNLLRILYLFFFCLFDIYMERINEIDWENVRVCTFE